MFPFVHICVCGHICYVYALIHASIHTHTHTHVCMYRDHAPMQSESLKNIHTCIHTYIHTYIHTHICTYAHTWDHAPMQSGTYVCLIRRYTYRKSLSLMQSAVHSYAKFA